MQTKSLWARWHRWLLFTIIVVASPLAIILTARAELAKQMNAASDPSIPLVKIEQVISSSPLSWDETAFFRVTITNTSTLTLPAVLTNRFSGPFSTDTPENASAIIGPNGNWNVAWAGQPLTGSTGVIRNQVQVTVPSSWAENLSYCTTCAEEDNINVPLFGDSVSQFRITATHPTYEIRNDTCAADFSGCSQTATLAPGTVTCDILYDDGVDVFSVCQDSQWWRPNMMAVTVGINRATGHRLVWNRKIAGENSWPELLVLYQDGHMRLKPQPPLGVDDVCFGSSVIVGPAKADPFRPFVEIEQINLSPSTLSLQILYREGTSAQIDLTADRTMAQATVLANYDTSNSFATFRSMFVAEENADVARVTTSTGDFGLIELSPNTWSTAWSALSGPSWFFYRQSPSRHNTSAPDILIEALDGYQTAVSTLAVCAERCPGFIPLAPRAP